MGSGKTSLLRLIAQEVDGDSETNARYLIAPNLRTANQLLRLMCDNFEVKTARSYGATRRRHGIMAPSMVRRLRKAVKQVGKEAATHRFTQAEKESLRDIVYTYRRQGYRTGENEIARIGVNWLVEDYRENGKRSVLHRILKALKE